MQAPRPTSPDAEGRCGAGAAAHPGAATHPEIGGPFDAGATTHARRSSLEWPAPAGVGQVVLVGAGPGDPGLITVAGQRLLTEADVVVADRLAGTALLRDLPARVQVIDVGKCPGNHPVPQEVINQLLVDHARAGHRVVRLKGGDPFLFGRGGEEVAACREAGVPVAVVPGVTSAFAVPAEVGIPVTHRGLARGVTVVSGHEDPDHEALVRLGGTLVVLMGVTRLPQLVDGLLQHGLAPGTPVAILESGWTGLSRVTRARADEIVGTAERREVHAPAVIVIGEVAALAEERMAARAEEGPALP